MASGTLSASLRFIPKSSSLPLCRYRPHRVALGPRFGRGKPRRTCSGRLRSRAFPLRGCCHQRGQQTFSRADDASTVCSRTRQTRAHGIPRSTTLRACVPQNQCNRRGKAEGAPIHLRFRQNPPSNKKLQTMERLGSGRRRLSKLVELESRNPYTISDTCRCHRVAHVAPLRLHKLDRTAERRWRNCIAKFEAHRVHELDTTARKPRHRIANFRPLRLHEFDRTAKPRRRDCIAKFIP